MTRRGLRADNPRIDIGFTGVGAGSAGFWIVEHQADLAGRFPSVRDLMIKIRRFISV
jgi:hypothetical protein